MSSPFDKKISGMIRRMGRELSDNALEKSRYEDKMKPRPVRPAKPTDTKPAAGSIKVTDKRSSRQA